VVLVPVAFVQVMSVTFSGPVRMRFAIVAVVAESVVAVADPVTSELVARFEIVPEAALIVEAVMSVAASVVTPKFVMVPKVANKLVVVTEVLVTDPNCAFQRWVASPSEKARSVVGIRFEETVPDTVRVEVTVSVLAVVPPSNKVVPVAVRLEVVSPPNNDRAWLVVAPLAVTLASVSASAAAATHPTPFDRQIPVPLIVAVAKLAVSAYRKELDAWLKKAFEEEVMPLMERLVPVALVKVVFCSWVRPVAAKAVVVTFVPVAFVKVTPFKRDSPITVKVEVTVEEEARKPPSSWRVAVATAPRLVTVRRVSASLPAGGQPVPFDRQMFCPATVAVANVPTSL